MRVVNDLKPGTSNRIVGSGSLSGPGPSLWPRKLVLTALLTLWVSVPYYSLQHWPVFPVHAIEPNAIDRAIPLVERTAWLYLSLFLLLALMVIAMATPRDVSDSALGVAVIALVSHVIFLLWPTSVPRPPGPPTDIAYRLVLQVDVPLDACPSLHASMSVYSALWCNR